MNQILVDFESIPWENPAPGVRYKAFIKGNQRLRLLEFSDSFIEPDWCIKGHAAYVIDGEFSLHLKDGIVHLKKGDIGFIPAGDEYGHKAVLEEHEKVKLLLFELI
jgi:hypothetical protein